GQLKHVFVIGGCDGTEGTRSYFTDLAADTPDDSIILTLGCGKFRLNGRDYGTIGGIPRLLDVGQCNDAYGAVVIATKLAEALGCGVHDLPLHFAVSWFEQKAVAVLLTLLHLELKNIRLGPNLPAFITPKVLAVLGEKFGLKPANIHAEDEDLEAMLQGK
ncbi:hcp, partial [Symbiodinium sp. CCMP2456]